MLHRWLAGRVCDQEACLRIGHADLVGIDDEVDDMIRLETEIHGLDG